MDKNSKKILLVDDNVDTSHHLSEWLRLHGFAVDRVSSAREAVARAASHRFDAVLLDLKNRGDVDYSDLLELRMKLPSCELVMLPAARSAA